jgi:hypothetical protein
MSSLDPKNEIANVDAIAFVDYRSLLNAPPIYVSAIRTVQVRNDKTTVTEEQLGVLLGNIPFRQQKVVPLHTSNAHFNDVE